MATFETGENGTPPSSSVDSEYGFVSGSRPSGTKLTAGSSTKDLNVRAFMRGTVREIFLFTCVFILSVPLSNKSRGRFLLAAAVP